MYNIISHEKNFYHAALIWTIPKTGPFNSRRFPMTIDTDPNRLQSTSAPKKIAPCYMPIYEHIMYVM